MRYFLLADDLSGALDAAAAFHHAGWPVRIVLSAAAWSEARSGEFVAFTTETRNASPATAAVAVAQALQLGHERGAQLAYKKIDSTLRGPVAAELQALTAARPAARVLFAPANPAVGRTVRDGVLRVQGVPVAETEFGRDPACPVRESAVRALLGPAAGGRVVVPDTETASDLAAAVARMAEEGGEWVAVGSGALARPVAARLVPAVPRWAEAPAAAVPGPPLMVCGSAHAANRRQAQALATAEGVDPVALRLDAPEAAIATVADRLRRGHAAALLVQEERHPDSAWVVRCLAGAVAEILRRSGSRRVFVTGGETAFALCRLVGIASLTFAAEIEPGLSLAHGETPAGAYWLAIKPGGFGDESTWRRAWAALAAVPGRC